MGPFFYNFGSLAAVRELLFGAAITLMQHSPRQTPHISRNVGFAGVSQDTPGFAGAVISGYRFRIIKDWHGSHYPN